VRSARSSATRRSSRSQPASEKAALAAVIAYFAAVVTLAAGDPDTAALEASADLVVDGELWRLLTSGLLIDGAAVPQIVLTAAAAFVFIRRCGALLWWAVVLVGHVGSALLAYAIIGVAVALGSGGAEAAADDPDFGISCVLAATLGGLFASGMRVVGAIGFLLLLPFSLDWYGPEHPLSFALGYACAVSWARIVPASK
jgi:hypothetical protein